MGPDIYLFILACSALLLLGAFSISIYGLRFSGFRIGWALIAAATFLMAVHRAITFKDIWTEPEQHTANLAGELVTLTTSLLLVLGLGLAPPAIRVIQRRLQASDAAHDALQESEAKYRALIESTGTGYVILDHNGNVQDCNDEYIRLTGRQGSSDVIGHNIEEWYEPESSSDRIQDEISKFSEGLIGDYRSGRFRSPSGSSIPVDLRGSVTVSEQGYGTTFLIADASERIKVKKELQESLTKYRTLIESTDTGYMILDGDGLVLDCNEKYVELTGSSGRDKIIGMMPASG